MAYHEKLPKWLICGKKGIGALVLLYFFSDSTCCCLCACEQEEPTVNGEWLLRMRIKDNIIGALSGRLLWKTKAVGSGRRNVIFGLLLLLWRFWQRSSLFFSIKPIYYSLFILNFLQSIVIVWLRISRRSPRSHNRKWPNRSVESTGLFWGFIHAGTARNIEWMTECVSYFIFSPQSYYYWNNVGVVYKKINYES